MSAVTTSVLENWRFEPWLVLHLSIAMILYARGWRRLHRNLPRRFGVRTIACFAAGLVTIFVALSSPIDRFASLLLQAHMAQHLLLAMVAPPLLLLGTPLAPLLRGIPRTIRSHAVAPLVSSPPILWLRRQCGRPEVGLLAFVLSMLGWHVPAMYELALRSPFWHVLEHACFFATGLLFWRPVVLPWPARPQWPRWTMVVYLIAADLQNTVLSAFFVFGERIIYPTYAHGFHPWGISALDDQAAAGVLMWVPGSLVYLVPAVWIAFEVTSVRRGVRPSEFFRTANTPPATRPRGAANGDERRRRLSVRSARR